MIVSLVCQMHCKQWQIQDFWRGGGASLDRGHQFGWGGGARSDGTDVYGRKFKKNRLSLSKIGAERRMHGAAVRDGRA